MMAGCAYLSGVANGFSGKYSCDFRRLGGAEAAWGPGLLGALILSGIFPPAAVTIVLAFLIFGRSATVQGNTKRIRAILHEQTHEYVRDTIDKLLSAVPAADIPQWFAQNWVPKEADEKIQMVKDHRSTIDDLLSTSPVAKRTGNLLENLLYADALFEACQGPPVPAAMTSTAPA